MATKGMNPAPIKLPLQGFLPYIPLLLLGYVIADLTIIGFRDLLLPNQAPPVRPAPISTDSLAPRGTYNPIISRNIFNSEGLIPEPIFSPGSKEQGPEADPVPSQLPLGLIGTIVHSNPDKSIANIEIKGRNINLAVTPKKDIENIATLVRVERNKAIIRNLNNGRLEFIEIKSSNKISFSTSQADTPAASTVVKQTAPNRFEINRADLNRYLSDVSGLLMQASSMPRKKPNGEIECFVINSIQQGSVFTQLGVMNGDCIKNVNGEPIDSPAKALELFSALKNSSSIKITVERDGRDMEKDYTIK